jgi:hypothetical protein
MSRLSNWWFGRTGAEVYDLEQWETKNIGDIVIPEKLTHLNSFVLANSVSEIFFPVDFYADRISKLRFYIATKAGKEIINTELNRFIKDGINPLYSFSDLIYNYVFSLLSDGNVFNYLGVPSIYANINASTIERWDVLQPNLVWIDENTNLSSINVRSWSEYIRRANYNEGGIQRNELDKTKLFIHNSGFKKRPNSAFLTEGLLWKANKSIDTLLSVYSARYNVYANNGMAGILAKKESKSGPMQTSLMNGNKRDEIIADLKERHGLVGKKNIFGISGTPIEFIKTLATISDLMPLDETLECSIKIAAPFQIPAGLIPRKDQSTFDNQASNEQSVWENGLLSMAETVCQNLTKMFVLPSTVKIMLDSSNVSALTKNESDKEDLTLKKLANIEKMKTLSPELDITQKVNEIYRLDYGTEK